MIHNTPLGEALLFHTKFIKLTYSCETEKTGRRENGNKCVYITQNKLSRWRINNEAVNMCARPLPTNHSLCQNSGANTNSHIRLRGESGISGFEGRVFVFLCLPASTPCLCCSAFCPVSPQKPADVWLCERKQAAGLRLWLAWRETCQKNKDL